MKLISTLLMFLFLATKIIGQQNVAEQWMEQKGILFEENLGQIVDLQSKPVSNALFQASAKGVDLYITKQGITYVFRQIAPQEEGKEVERAPVNWARVDMQLQNANIDPKNISKEGAANNYSNYYLAHCHRAYLM